MTQNHFIKIIGTLLVLSALLIIIFTNPSRIISVLMGMLLGIGISLISSGDDIKVFGRQIFKKQKPM